MFYLIKNLKHNFLSSRGMNKNYVYITLLKFTHEITPHILIIRIFFTLQNLQVRLYQICLSSSKYRIHLTLLKPTREIIKLSSTSYTSSDLLARSSEYRVHLKLLRLVRSLKYRIHFMLLKPTHEIIKISHMHFMPFKPTHEIIKLSSISYAPQTYS